MIIGVGKTEETCYGVTFIHQEFAILLPNNETKVTQQKSQHLTASWFTWKGWWLPLQTSKNSKIHKLFWIDKVYAKYVVCWKVIFSMSFSVYLMDLTVFCICTLSINSTFIANSCTRSPAHTGCVWASTKPGSTHFPVASMTASKSLSFHNCLT